MGKRKLIAFMNSYTQGASGGDICFIELAKRVNKFEKTVVTSLLGKKLCESKGLTANYLIATKEQIFRNVIFTYFKRIIKAIFLSPKVDNGDILYSTSDFLPDVFPVFCQKIKNKKVYWVQKIFHLIPADRFIPHSAQKISFFLIRYFADLAIVDNQALKEELTQQGFNINRVELNYPGIDTDYFKNIGTNGSKYYDATFLGRLHPSKGIFDLVEVWKLVCENKPDAKLAIIGGGDKRFKRELKKKIKDTNLECNIDVLGYLEGDEAFRMVKAGKVFVFPSHEEGFGIAILEAMACGLPVVAWDLPVYREVFSKGVIRIPIGNTKEFAKAILSLLEDEQLHKDISREAKEISQRYDWDKIAKRELELIENLARKEEHETAKAT